MLDGTRILILGSLAAMLVAAGCDRDSPRELGPVNGADLPPADTGRVAVGDTAPDFTLLSRSGDPITLSDFRGEKDVLLVFYRGHW